jgi:hypothetical protein
VSVAFGLSSLIYGSSQITAGVNAADFRANGAPLTARARAV